MTGYTIKHVPLDFDWPLGINWHGCTPVPSGNGWQAWSGDYCPVSPVAATADALIAWFVTEDKMSQEAAQRFVYHSTFFYPLSDAPTIANCHAVLDAHGVPLGRLGQRVQWVLAERARLQHIEALALGFRVAIKACDGIQAAEAALLEALEAKEKRN